MGCIWAQAPSLSCLNWLFIKVFRAPLFDSKGCLHHVPAKASSRFRQKSRRFWRITYWILMKVVVVESPSKAKTINKYLGAGYEVLASFGHIRDLVTGPQVLIDRLRLGRRLDNNNF